MSGKDYTEAKREKGVPRREKSIMRLIINAESPEVMTLHPI